MALHASHVWRHLIIRTRRSGVILRFPIAARFSVYSFPYLVLCKAFRRCFCQDPLYESSASMDRMGLCTGVFECVVWCLVVAG